MVKKISVSNYDPGISEEAQEFFDKRFICGICHGLGQVRKRIRSGPGVTVRCGKCQGTGMFATGNQLRKLVEEIEDLKSQAGDQVTFMTDDSHAITVTRSGDGVAIRSSTGDLQGMMLADNAMAIVVRNKGE